MTNPILTVCGKQSKDGDGSMKSTSFGRRTMARLLLGAGLVGSTTVHAQWYFEVGPVYRGDMEISVQGGSRAAESGVQAEKAGTVGRRPSLPENLLEDDGTAQVLREFDDGYVGPSDWEWAQNDGLTQFWGYDSSDQYNADADTLTFQATMGDSASQRRTTTRTWTESAGWTGRRRTDGFGIMGTLGYLLRNEDNWRLGAQLRLGWLDGIRGNFRDRTAFRQNIERSVYETTLWRDETYTYTYDTQGNPVFPEAPYAMMDPDAVGPMIGDTPESIALSSQQGGSVDRLIGRSRSVAASTVDLKVEAQVFTLQLGPRLLWEPEGRVALLFQPALTANLLDADMRRQETFRHPNGTAIASWSDRSDKQAWRMGAGVEAGAQVALSQQWHVTGSGGYEWVDKFNLKSGPDRIRLDVSGYQLELAIGRSF